MKNLFKSIALFIAVSVMVSSCSDDKEPTSGPDLNEYGWSDVMMGNDLEEIAWPDMSENYWEYTLDLSANPGMGLRFKGKFPVKDTRFFNLTFYDDQTTQRLASIEDFDITPEGNGKNPFNTEGVTSNDSFVVNVLPSNAPQSLKDGLQNLREFPASTKKLSVLLRVYYNSIDHGPEFGDVDLPEIVFIDAQTGEEKGAAIRGNSNYYELCKRIINSIPTITSQQAMVFTLAPDVMYSNGPTGYVTAANTVQDGNILTFRFIPPVHPTKVSENRTADVRYWSICAGDMQTITPYTLPDRQVIKDGEYVNFIVVAKNDKYYDAISAKAAAMKINVITWDSEKRGEALMVFYRQMHIKTGYEFSVRNIPAYPPIGPNGLPDTSAQIEPDNMAHVTLGDHGPCGLKLESTFFISDYFTKDYLRLDTLPGPTVD